MRTSVRKQRSHWLWVKLATIMILGGTACISLPGAVLASTPSPGITIRVRVNNYTQASDAVLASAEGEANRIFSQAGLSISWLDCSTGRSEPIQPDPCRAAPEPSDIILRILSAPSHNQFQDNTFGFVVYPFLATVYYDRALARARSDDASFEVHFILGAVIAHELGHLLIGSNSHSDSGVMRARWEGRQIRQAVTGNLHFTPKQALLMHAQTIARRQLTGN